MAVANYIGSEIVSGKVLADWIDINNHMNVAYYILAFDQAVDKLWEKFGITVDFVNTTNSSTFAVESHITWQRELSVGESYIITTQVLAFDEKRIHLFMRMYHAEKHYLASTAEWLNLHVDLTVRKVAPWPDDIRERISAFAAQHEDQSWPLEAGSKISVPNPLRGRTGSRQ